MKSDITEFVNACIAKGEGEGSGNTKHNRKYYNIINKVYLQLKTEQRLAEYPGFLPLLLFRGSVPRFSSFPTVVFEHPIALAMALLV